MIERLQALAADPYSDASYDPTWRWWTAEYGAGTGFLTFVNARDDHLVVVRLIDASWMEHLRRDPDVQRERPLEYEDHHLMRSLLHPTPIRSAHADRGTILAARPRAGSARQVTAGTDADI